MWAHRGFPCKICESNSQKRRANNRAYRFAYAVPIHCACERACALLCGNFKVVSIFYRLLCVEHHNDVWVYSACTQRRSSTTKNTNGNKAIEVSSLTDHHIRENHLTFQRIPINLNHSNLLLTHYGDCVRLCNTSVFVAGAYKVRCFAQRVQCTYSRFDGIMLKPIATIT